MQEFLYKFELPIPDLWELEEGSPDGEGVLKDYSPQAILHAGLQIRILYHEEI